MPSQEVDDVVFRVRFGGYDEWQVDVYLDRIARQLGELEERGVLGRAPSPEFAGGPAGNAGGRDAGMPMRDSGPVPMHDGPPMRGDGPMRDGPMPPPMHDGPPMRGDGPMPPRDMPMRDGPMMSPPREPMGPRDFGPPRDMPMRDTPPPPDMTMPMREAPMPPRDMPMRDTPGPMREPSPPRDMPMRQQAPMHGGSEPTMMMNQASPPRDLPPMRDEPSTPPPMNRRPGPPPPPPGGPGPGPGSAAPIEDDGEGFGHLRPSDDEGFGHLRGGDDFDDPFAGHRGRRGGAPAGFESAAPMSGPPHPQDDRFGGPPPPDDRFGGPPPPDDRFGGPPPPPDDRFGGPPPPDDRFGGPPPDDRFGPPSGHFDAEPRPPQPGGMMPPPPPPPPPGQWGEPVSPAGPPGFDRRPPEPFDQDADMTRPLRRPMGDPPPTLPDSELTQRLRRGGEDRFGAAPPPPPPPPGPGRGGPPPRRDMEPPTPPRGVSGDPDIPTMAHPVIQNPPGGRPPSPYDDPQGYRDGPPGGPGGPDSGRRNPYEGRPYEGRGVFDEPGRHGRDEMTTEMNAGDSPFQPEDVQRVEQLRSSFKPRRFGSGYDPVQVTRIFDAMSSNMTKRSPVAVTDKELDTRQFSLVQQGYFEPEVDAALREVRDIFAKRGMIRD
nr:DivIVA domain-containing protein [Stackebrandtia nassauensis]